MLLGLAFTTRLWLGLVEQQFMIGLGSPMDIRYGGKLVLLQDKGSTIEVFVCLTYWLRLGVHAGVYKCCVLAYLQGESGGKNIENEYNRALEEIQRLLQEVASLKVSDNIILVINLSKLRIPEWPMSQALICHRIDFQKQYHF